MPQAQTEGGTLGSHQVQGAAYVGHGKHAGHDPEMFRKRFWLTVGGAPKVAHLVAGEYGEETTPRDAGV